MSIITVKDKIVEKLGDMQTLNAVFGYEATNPQGKYPFASVTLAGGTGEFASTAHNLRTRHVWVRVYQERTEVGQGDEQAETIVANVINEMEQAFDMDTTLSGTCKYAQPIEWEADYVDREHDSRLITVTIEAVELMSAQ